MKHSCIVFDAPKDVAGAREAMAAELLVERVEQGKPPCEVSWTVEPVSEDEVEVTAHPKGE